MSKKLNKTIVGCASRELLGYCIVGAVACLLLTGIFYTPTSTAEVSEMPEVSGVRAVPFTVTASCDMTDWKDATKKWVRRKLAYVGTGSLYYMLQTQTGKYFFIPKDLCILENPTWKSPSLMPEELRR